MRPEIRQALLWTALIAAAVFAFALYKARSTSVNVEPHAADEIEKAKRR